MEIYSCPSCRVNNTAVLADSILLICKGCASVVFARGGPLKSIQTAVPPDWSFIQLNTQGQYGGKAFTVVGRMRLQLRNDYKNFWFCDGGLAQSFILMESFASFVVLIPSWQSFTKDVRHLRAGQSISLKGDLKVQGEYVEKCEGMSFQGEIVCWNLFSSGFFFIQASNKNNKTAVFVIDGKDNIKYLTGERIDWRTLNLTNIVHWDEWK